MVSGKFRGFMEALLKEAYDDAVKILTRKVIIKGEGRYDWSKINRPEIKELFVEKFLDHVEKKKRGIEAYIQLEGYQDREMVLRYSKLINKIEEILKVHLSSRGDLMASKLDSFTFNVMKEMGKIFK